MFFKFITHTTNYKPVTKQYHFTYAKNESDFVYMLQS